ncbi:MAG TPA: AMP-dependent synthetase/ligase, partial [Acidimicrobiia bacterium]|nr:AMP-dependent synthetase/ligase [Acidimicrobiia bacterium]
MSRATIDQAVDGLTVAKAFRRTVEERGDAVALRWQDGDGWSEWTWNDYADRATRLAAAFRSLGLEPGGRLAIMMRNVPEFHPTDVAALLCGATPFSIYNSSSPEQVQYLVDHSEASIAVVEDVGFLERFLKVRDEMPHLKHLVVLRDPDGMAPDDVLSWESLLEHDPVDLAEASEIAQPDDLVTLIYTSGTTGPPKGVMLNHHNVCWTAEGFRHLYPESLAGARLVSYLPMAHIAERMVSHYNGLYYGTEVTTCPEASLVGQYLGQVKPELFFAVPRVWEKLHAGILAAVGGDPEKREQLDQALAVGRQYQEARLSGGEIPADVQAAYEQVEPGLSLVRSLVGLDGAKIAFSGAAPITDDVLWFFLSLGVPMSEIYGLSETTGPLTWDPFEVRVGSVGRAWPGCEVRLADDGEVLGRGGNIFQGYFREPEKTAEALDDEGWLHSGDIGEIDDDGYLCIVDRKKELIITAGGKNISPANVEKELKSLEPIGQAAVIGDRRPYLVALLVLDPDTAPGWAKSLGVEGSLDELAENETVVAEVTRLVGEVNQQFNNQEQVKKFKL